MARRAHEWFPIDDRPGWFLTNEGDEVYSPHYAAIEKLELRQLLDELDSFARRRALAELEAINTAPMVRGIALAGERPTGPQVAAIAGELDKVPRAVIRHWRDLGGRAEVVPGKNAARHPQCPEKIKFAWGWHWPALQDLIAIAGEIPPATVLHELGHSLDRGRRYSASAEWQAIHKTEKDWADFEPMIARLGPYHLSAAEESFAETFSNFYHAPETRSALSEPMRRFIARTVATI